MNNFLHDVLKGLQSCPKYLDSKYFYDKNGDEIFQKIMECDEYYLTTAEMEIFSKQQSQIADNVLCDVKKLDIIEFGPGDAIKSIYLLKELLRRNGISNYLAIDISENIINLLNKNLPKQVPGLPVHGFVGEYLEMLSSAIKISSNRKLVLFLGANIGNFKFNEMPGFLKRVRRILSLGDLVAIGFDLKKNPKKILAAYNDRSGLTSEFNLNLLNRINKELSGNFTIGNFEHYATYDPLTGACKSFLISCENQSVKIDDKIIRFEKDEPIFMEISQKYSINEINDCAAQCGFEVAAQFFDMNRYFVDVIFKCS